VFDFILNPIELAVSWVLVGFHTVLSPLLGADEGSTWALSIVGLVLVIRVALIPLFVKQIRSQRNMQLIQPQMKAIQTKYAGDKQKQSEEMMKLYQETGTNPFSSCLPLLAQSPIFFGLFTVLQGIAQQNYNDTFGQNFAHLMESAHNASILDVPLYATFLTAGEAHLAANQNKIQIACAILVVLMTLTMFITQRQLLVKNVAADNPMIQQQKVMMYLFPLLFAVGGVGFPIGVLIYWLTTNIWSMGQQFYVIRNSPAPGTPAHEAYLERQRQKDLKKGIVTESSEETKTETEIKRVQPKRAARSKRKK
jgi:YidC/Oxa1 family membrane protein insertase